MLTIKTNLKYGIINSLKKINDVSKKAERRATKRLAETIKNEFIEEIRKDYAIKSSALKKGIDIIQGLETRIVVKGRQGVPLSRFSYYQTEKGVSYIVSYKKGRKLMKSAFVAKMESGHIGIFKRITITRLPIEEKFGPDLRLKLINQRYMRLYNNIIKTKYNELYQKEFTFYLQREIFKK